MRAVLIRPYRDADAGAFKALNVAWIEHYFRVEATDLKALDHPERILADGGAILMAELDGAPVGCCALIRYDADTLEVAKMAVSETHRGMGIGAALMEAIVAEGQARGVSRLYIESNAKLTPALTLYEKFGFQHLPQERRPNSPYARADVFMERLLR
jgi:putative acetyltransferase